MQTQYHRSSLAYTWVHVTGNGLCPCSLSAVVCVNLCEFVNMCEIGKLNRSCCIMAFMQVRCYFGDNEQRWYMWYSGNHDAQKPIAAIAPSSGCTGVPF